MIGNLPEAVGQVENEASASYWTKYMTKRYHFPKGQIFLLRGVLASKAMVASNYRMCGTHISGQTISLNRRMW